MGKQAASKLAIHRSTLDKLNAARRMLSLNPHQLHQVDLRNRKAISTTGDDQCRE